ncbi:uncharacterized protein LOC130276510 [Hyla sarda]|uniref:uncharacterized protein LOC130276510 n=1 Tax=Hyla sarda TaxID=327740 RepID=UPI0024C353D9|nr:uncharacterized protein LOC130276510 [Hyla sarda]
MQAISSFHIQSQESTAENVEEEIAGENSEHAHSEAVMGQEDIGVGDENVPCHREELLLPSDLGLSANQTTYINDYTNQHLQFMTRVDRRFEDLQLGMNKLADAYLTGSNQIQKGLNQIAQILQETPPKNNANVASRATNRPPTGQNTEPENVDSHILQVSPSSEQTNISATSITTVRSNATHSISSGESILEDDDSSSGQPIDLTLPLPQLATFPNQNDLNMYNFAHCSSSAHFLISCKKELAMEDVAVNSDSVAPHTLALKKKLGPGHQAQNRSQPPPPPNKKAKK